MVDVILLDALGADDPVSYLDIVREYHQSAASGADQSFFSARTVYDATVFTTKDSLGNDIAYLGHVAITPDGQLGFNPGAVISGMVGGASVHDFLAGQMAHGRGADFIWKKLLVGDDFIRGNNATDPLSRPHELHGYAGDDIITGGTLRVGLFGEQGNDILFLGNSYGGTGGTGRDIFVLDDETCGGISDFSSGIDKIALDTDTFPDLADGITTENIRFGTVAKDADDRLIVKYDTKTQVTTLYYDDDGTGSDKQRLIDSVGGGDQLKLRDFTVVRAGDLLPVENQSPAHFTDQTALPFVAVHGYGPMRGSGLPDLSLHHLVNLV